MDIIHEEKEENYWDLKANKGTLSSVIIGNVLDVEIMISGKEGNYDLIFAHWRMGQGYSGSTVIPGALTAGVAAIPAAAVSNYRAHSFKKNFWDFIKKDNVRHRK